MLLRHRRSRWSQPWHRSAGSDDGTPWAKVSPDLIGRARSGDLGALEALIGEYQLPVGRFVVSQIGPDDDALDVCQTIFVKMMRGLPRLESSAVFEPWLYRIARNVCIDHLRHRRSHRRLFVPLTEAHDMEAGAEGATLSRELESLEGAVKALGASHRQLLDLSLERPRTTEELARLTSSSVAAVKNRLLRARERLRKLVRRGKDTDES